MHIAPPLICIPGDPGGRKSDQEDSRLLAQVCKHKIGQERNKRNKKGKWKKKYKQTTLSDWISQRKQVRSWAISFHHFASPAGVHRLIEAAALESTTAGQVNADRTSLGRLMVHQRHLEACIGEAFDLQDTCSDPHHTAYQPCRGTAYFASGPSSLDGDAKVTATGEVLGTEQCSCRSYAVAPAESAATFDPIGSCNQVFPETWSPLYREVLV